MIGLLSGVFAWLHLTLAVAAQAGDASWPERPIRLIVPFPAGSSTDILARIVGQRLGVALGQQVIIENRVGASGHIGVEAVARAAPDGYTLGIATASTHAVAASLTAKLPYDPLRDFTPVTMLAAQSYVLVVYAGVPARSTAELIALAKAKPGTISYGSAGVASLAHLATALFASMAGLNIVHVPYKSSAQSISDMITGRLEMQFATIAPALSHIRAGQLRALATSGRQRATTLAEVPTVAEAALPGYEAVLWIAMVAPSGTSAGIVSRLNQELNQFLRTPEASETLVGQGMQAELGGPDLVTERIRADTEKWRAVMTKAGIKPE
jgi:tripartite-type tricarboxylate transporter receptor subunit TctC